MASILKRPSGKWQAQVRVNGSSISKTFRSRNDAKFWARHIEASADRDQLPNDQGRLKEITLADVLVRYRKGVTSTKQAGRN